MVGKENPAVKTPPEAVLCVNSLAHLLSQRLSRCAEGQDCGDPALPPASERPEPVGRLPEFLPICEVHSALPSIMAFSCQYQENRESPHLRQSQGPTTTCSLLGFPCPHGFLLSLTSQLSDVSPAVSRMTYDTVSSPHLENAGLPGDNRLPLSLPAEVLLS